MNTITYLTLPFDGYLLAAIGNRLILLTGLATSKTIVDQPRDEAACTC
jgi:hypothetical protein